MAFKYPMVELEAPFDHNGKTLTHLAVTKVTFDVNPGQEAFFVTAYFGTSDKKGNFIPDFTRKELSYGISKKEARETFGKTTAKADELPSMAGIRAALSWVMEKGDIEGAVIS